MSKPFFIPNANSKPVRNAEAIDVAARYLAYKLYEATNGQLGAWHVLREIGETKATVARAVERGWVLVRQDDGHKVKLQSASLTDEGRRLARKGVRGYGDFPRGSRERLTSGERATARQPLQHRYADADQKAGTVSRPTQLK